MLLCFSKRSPVIKKQNKCRKMNRSWSPDCYERDRYNQRWYNGEKYIRAGDEYKPCRLNQGEMKNAEEKALEEGFRRNRYNRDMYNKRDECLLVEKSAKRSSYGTDVEDRHTASVAKAIVHSDGVNTASEAFRSSLLWKELDPNKLPKGNEVLSTFPPNRYSIVPEVAPQICQTPVTAKKKPKFRVNLDVSHYAPNEIVVQVEEGFLLAEGKHFAESDFGYETCEFYRKYPLPEGLDGSDIVYKINTEGILVVTGGACNENALAKKQNSLNDETKVASAKKNEIRYSSYDNIAKESSASKAGKIKHHVAFGDFNLIDDQTYVLLVAVDGYSPENMKVKVLGNELSVTGSKKVESRDGKEKRVLHKEFTKTFNVPSDADVDSILSRMTSDGNLKIECTKLT